MKKIILAVFLAIFAVGCSQVNSVLTLAPYNNQKVAEFADKSVYIANINDKRDNQSIIATITDSDGSVAEYVTLQNNLAYWLREALAKELKAKGVNVVSDNSEAQSYINIDIASLKGNIQGYSKENMSASGEIYITIYRGATTINKRISQSQTEFAPIRTGGAFSPFMDNLLRDIVRKSAEQIASNI